VSALVLWGAAGLAAAATAGASALGALDPNSRLFGPVVSHGPTQSDRVYLTFDDGPNPGATARILDILGEHEARATFFLVGRHAEMFPELARRVARAGHDLGNHTYDHRKLHFLSRNAIRRELVDAHDAIAEATDVEPALFRAPHGYRNPYVALEARRLGYTTFGWKGSVFDTARPGPAEIRRRVSKLLKPGAIILLHDGDGYDPQGDRSQTAAALPAILHDIRERGLVPGKLSELR
jgi:peptidoglycan/xylan/chitin deacetylase (PgdA/CDA1 family)